MFSKAFVTLLAYASASAVFAAPATPLELATVKQQFTNALIVPGVVPVFDPSALLDVTFPTGEIKTGDAVTKENAGPQPVITIVGTDASFASGGNLNSNTKYTLMMVDGDYAGAPANAQGINVHWLQNDFTFGAVDADELKLDASTPAIIPYAGPGPASGSGPHRYIILLFAQPTTFTPPAQPPAGSVTRTDLAAYIKNANLGNPIAANYFTVEVGTATVQVSPTSAVDTATLSVPAASGTAGSTSQTGSASGAKGTGGTSSGNGAVATGASALAVSLFGMVAAAILA